MDPNWNASPWMPWDYGPYWQRHEYDLGASGRQLGQRQQPPGKRADAHRDDEGAESGDDCSVLTNEPPDHANAGTQKETTKQVSS